MLKLEETIHTFIEKPHGYERPAPAIKIAVLDTGIDEGHPTIKQAIKKGRIKVIRRDFVPGVSIVDNPTSLTAAS